MTKVIACIDGTDISTAVSDYASWASLRMEAPLEFLHVLDKSEFPIKKDYSGNLGLGSRSALLDELSSLDEKRGKLALEQGRLMLEQARDRAIRDGVKSPLLKQRHGSLLETLAAMEDDIRLLVLGKHEDHLNDHVGSRLENVVRTMHRPILITTSEYKQPETVMIAFDGSPTTRKGVELIARGSLFKGVQCHIVLVGKDNSANKVQLEWAHELMSEHGKDNVPVMIEGEVETVLCDYRAKHDVDMLVMGAYGHSTIRRFLVGSSTTSIMRNACVPVLLVR